MDLPSLAALLLGTGLALAIGYALGRVRALTGKAAALDAARREAEATTERAQREADLFRSEVLEPERVRLSEQHTELAKRQERLDQKSTDLKERQTGLRDKQVAFREKTERRKARFAQQTRQQEARAAALEKTIVAQERAVEAVSAVVREAETRRAEAERLAGTVQKQAQAVGRRQQELATREHDATERENELDDREERVEGLNDEYVAKLEQVAGLSRAEALRRLTAEIEREAKLQAASSVKAARDEAKLIAQRQAREVILAAISRTAAPTAIETTTSTVQLQSDDMKGRIIGREGRNIRAFEAATGVEVVVDETPETVLLSSFDPVRREIARLAMERLLADGRIHPARIEEEVARMTEHVDEEIVETGERVVTDLQLVGVHPELIRLVGRMRYRTSYGQNLLAHSIETAKLASFMASELGLDARKARRAGLLHDIGKVIEGDLESPHAIAGMEVCRRHKEHPEVCNAVGAHHDEIEMTSPISPLIQAADAVSGARPGARREALEQYVRRLRDIEGVAEGFEGVDKVYAIQAGREVRVIVDQVRISDAMASQLAVDISRRIEDELQYPGHVKVTVIREVRAIAYAR